MRNYPLIKGYKDYRKTDRDDKGKRRDKVPRRSKSRVVVDQL